MLPPETDTEKPMTRSTQLGLTFQGPKNVQVMHDIPIPLIEEPTDCIVKTTLMGLCGSDMHVFHGREAGCDQNTVMGHELVGTVHSSGSSFTKTRR